MEIKHGRAAMLGFHHVIAHKAGVVMPGYLSTSADLKFSDVPTSSHRRWEMKVAAIVSMGAVASAFAPGGPGAPRAVSVAAAVDSLLGVGPETGSKLFDPAGFSTYASADTLAWFRAAELKHGRVAMLATLGYVTADFVKLPGAIHQVSSLEAHNVFVESGAMTQILIWCFVAECIGYLAILEMLDGSGRKPGDFGFDPLKFGKADDPEMQLKELENGRLAMMAISGIVTQAALTGHTFPYI